MTQQTLLEGPTRTEQLRQKYVPTGAKGSQVIKTADQSYILWAGRSGCGKSYLLQSNPNACILNFDASPTTNPNCVAEIWPAVGSPPTWPDVTKKINEVIAAFTAKLDGAPSMVVFDSYMGALTLVRSYVAYTLYERSAQRRETQAKAVAEFDPFDIRTQDGRQVWDLAYDWINYEIAKLRAAGMGVGVILHVADEVVEFGEGDKKITLERPDLTTTESQLGRMYPFADSLLLIEKQDSVARKSVDETFSIRGKAVIRSKTIQTPSTNLLIISKGAPDSIQRYLKTRTISPLPPSIEIGPGDGWDTFATIYNKCSIGENT